MNEDRMIRSFLAEAPPSAEVIAEGRQRLLSQISSSEQGVREGRRGTRRTAFRFALAGLCMVTAAAVAALTLSVNGGSGQRNNHEEGQRLTGGAVELLDRIAEVAYSQPIPSVRDDMYVYVKSKVAEPAGKDVTPPHLRETWTPVADLCKPGYVDEGRDNRGPSGGDFSPCPYKGSLGSPTYRFLQTLPTDPKALLKWIYAQPKGSGADSWSDQDQQAFTAIGGLLYETVVPPRIAAALYRAAAMIPGVTVNPNAVDAVGRHGVAITHVLEISPSYNEREEWIFDRSSLQMIGERDILLRGGKPGAINPVDKVTHTVAILQRGFTNKAGQRP